MGGREDSYLEVKDDGPDEAEGQLGVAVHNVLSSDVDQFDFFVAQKPQSCLHILNGMEPHPTSFSRLEGRIIRRKNLSRNLNSHQNFSREDLEE